MAPENASGLARSSELARFDAALESASKRLDEDQRAGLAALEEQHESLRRTLTLVLDRWPNPNLMADPELHMVVLQIRLDAAAQVVCGHRLADAANVVAFAFHRE